MGQYIAIDIAASMLGVCKQTLRRWDETGKLPATRFENGYRKYPLDLILENIPATRARPFLKWAGGKGKLLPELLSRAPGEYRKYVEPFLGGGALFFALRPAGALLNDVNPELVNAYIQVRDNHLGLVDELKKHQKGHSEEYYYAVRGKSLSRMNEVRRAARFIYLNKTCFNGLHRVNRDGDFNVPIGRYKNPKIVDEENISACSEALQNADIFCLDYSDFIRSYCGKGDFVYLDPPYIPVSEYSDFDRYAQGKFRVGQQQKLALLYGELVGKGSYPLLSNSHTELSLRYYGDFRVEEVKAARSINKEGSGRGKISEVLVSPSSLREKCFPSTRYMGSKSALLPDIDKVLKNIKPKTVLDAFSGSGVVSYHLKKLGCRVVSNDFLSYSSTVTKALIENSKSVLEGDELDILLKKNRAADNFVSRTFAGLYFSDVDNNFIDNTLANIELLDCEYKKAIALGALSRACLKRRPRGIFTYVGFKYDDGRKDLSYSLREHFLFSVNDFNKAVFDNGKKNLSLNMSALDVNVRGMDLVYLDPPYFSVHSDNDYVRRYHFIEGLCRGWRDVEIQHDTKTKKFKKYTSPFDTKSGTYDAFERLCEKYANSKMLISYSSNCLPSKAEISLMARNQGRAVEVFEIDHKYSFGNQKHKVGNNNNSVREYLFYIY